MHTYTNAHKHACTYNHLNLQEIRYNMVIQFGNKYLRLYVWTANNRSISCHPSLASRSMCRVVATTWMCVYSDMYVFIRYGVWDGVAMATPFKSWKHRTPAHHTISSDNGIYYSYLKIQTVRHHTVNSWMTPQTPGTLDLWHYITDCS